jgi:hypothetical protein
MPLPPEYIFGFHGHGNFTKLYGDLNKMPDVNKIPSNESLCSYQIDDGNTPRRKKDQFVDSVPVKDAKEAYDPYRMPQDLRQKIKTFVITKPNETNLTEDKLLDYGWDITKEGCIFLTGARRKYDRTFCSNSIDLGHAFRRLKSVHKAKKGLKKGWEAYAAEMCDEFMSATTRKKLMQLAKFDSKKRYIEWGQERLNKVVTAARALQKTETGNVQGASIEKFLEKHGLNDRSDISALRSEIDTILAGPAKSETVKKEPEPPGDPETPPEDPDGDKDEGDDPPDEDNDPPDGENPPDEEKKPAEPDYKNLVEAINMFLETSEEFMDCEGALPEIVRNVVELARVRSEKLLKK